MNTPIQPETDQLLDAAQSCVEIIGTLTEIHGELMAVREHGHNYRLPKISARAEFAKQQIDNLWGVLECLADNPMETEVENAQDNPRPSSGSPGQ